MKTFLYVIMIITIAAFSGCKTSVRETKQKDTSDFSNILTPKEIQGGKLTPEILWKFGRVSASQLSPDGSKILYNVTRYDARTDKSRTWIFLNPARGGVPQNLTSDMPSCYSPWWISNSRIAFLSSKSGSSQIWTMNPDGSDKQCVSAVAGDITGFEFTNDGSKLFYLKRVKIDSTTQDKYPDLPLAKGRIITNLMYRHWDKWSDYAYSHVFVANYRNQKVTGDTDIMKGEPYDSPLAPYYDISEISWSPDGKMLAYSCKKLKGKAYSLSTNSDIYVYDVDQKTTEDITKGMMGYDRYPVFSPDSRKVAFESMATPGYESDKSRLFVYDFDHKTREYLTDSFDQDVSNCVWSADGKEIYFISGYHATYQIYSIDPATRKIKEITHGQHDYTSLAFNNHVMLGTRMSQAMAPELFRIDPQSGTETQVTFTNRNIYKVIKMGKSVKRWVKTTDGKKELVWVIYPPDFDPHKKYPALLYCQGGPQEAVSQFWSYRWNFQMMVANEYIVVAPNRRGLPTFGEAWNKEISGDYGGQDIKDYLSAIDEVKKEPYVNANRLGAVGASYGGYSVYYLAGCHQKRFKVFIAHCGIFDLKSESLATEEFWFTRHDLGGFYWDKPEPKSFTKFSPDLYVDKWDTPIMIITSANDFRIPYTQGLEAFDAAQLRGIPSKLLFFPDESHWVMKPQNSILWQREFFSWLDKYLK